MWASLEDDHSGSRVGSWAMNRDGFGLMCWKDGSSNPQVPSPEGRSAPALSYTTPTRPTTIGRHLETPHANQ